MAATSLSHFVSILSYLFFFFFLLLLTLNANFTAALGFACSTTNTTCQSFVGFAPQNATTLSAIATKFGLKSSSPLLGANGYPSNTSKNHKVAVGETVRVPISCSCPVGGRGYSDGSPKHTVAKGEYPYLIATEVFSGLVSADDILTVNKISDPTKISVGKVLRIPLPCSCDQGQSFPVAHYAHIVAKGSDLPGIATEFGTTEAELKRLNNISDSKSLLAGQVLDVPLRVCSSSIQNGSLDANSLSVPNGSYAFTAKNCVQCKCTTTWQLDCVPNPLNRQISKCPSMKCNGTDLVIGNSTAVAACLANVCTYAGYTSRNTILTTILPQSTCPAPTPSPTEGPPPSSAASRLQGGGRMWGWPLSCCLILALIFSTSLPS